MEIIKFVVRLNRSGHIPEYVQRIDKIPIRITTNLKLALVMGKLTAEDAVKSIQNSRRKPELVSVRARRGVAMFEVGGSCELDKGHGNKAGQDEQEWLPAEPTILARDSGGITSATARLRPHRSSGGIPWIA